MDSGEESEYGHLDATGDREVVYCHACGHEWYRDRHGLICPRPECESEATEIITPGNDPRDLTGHDPGFGHDHPHHVHDSDSDPDEDDIEEHLMGGPGGFYGRRMVFRNPEGPADGNRLRANPGEADEIISRFTELLGDIGGQRVVGRSGPDQLFSRSENAGPQRVSFTRFSGPGFGGQVTTFYGTGSDGSVRTTIRSGNQIGGGDNFQSIFGDLLGQMGPPPVGRGGLHGHAGEAGPSDQGAPPNAPLGMLLQQLFAQMLGPGAVHGDAVYSQEGLDRIISQLMEQNPSSNAPPPASEETIAKLPRKKLDEQMLGPELKGECTICIDEMKLGDEAVVLPCKHWFHDECVVLWLKEHNTCPICRAPIEGDAAGHLGATPATPQPAPPPIPSSSRPSESEIRRSNLRQRGSERLASIRDEAATSSSSSWRNPSRRNSDSPPQVQANPSRRDRSSSPSGRRSQHSDRSRDGGGGGGLFSRIRDSFSSRDRRHP
ncbi:hypothetical protein JX265_000249 [Neoarthrinium moseri]|uniref:RING-type E3 ubiquitin transferase n=1 Tax=Neoarthrinium moseri TaxID=1658444 RepID=A0A9P9WY45_9PEZI|nr:uncharacterized protein JN550_001051 [Neoarthrinium moseri]KAI1876979.1 hypothetical protein JN550_001051 [Neoarthrinium moseri]KAI1881423.1 hypothetical protein JX265_000249 [Neoarthrinium moseri]